MTVLDWWPPLGRLTDVYDALSGLEIFLVVLLSAITIFRRELSSNHCYVPSQAESSCDDENSQKSAADDDSTSKASTTSHVLGLLPTPEPEELLEGAGCFCSGYPYTSSLLHPSNNDTGTPIQAKPQLFITHLPLDAQVVVSEFLSPQDLLRLATVNRSARTLIQDPSQEASRRIWKRAWERDYAWMLREWDVGQRAVARSLKEQQHVRHLDDSFVMDFQTLSSTMQHQPPQLPQHLITTQDFYFSFSFTFVNYLLAGCNTHDCCLVGIGGHIYDLSLFLASHPGSPETVMAHAGQDATAFFETMNHSTGARRIAQSLCVIVDRAYCSRQGCGTKPTSLLNNGTATPPATFSSQTVIRQKGGLARMTKRLRQEESSFRAMVSNFQVKELLGEINLYYDPICQIWKAWYTNQKLETVFIDRLDEQRVLLQG